jgi:hypothetical protein
MHPIHEHLRQCRRNFLATTANYVGALAVASLMKEDGLLAAEANPLAPRAAQGEELHLHLPGRRPQPDRPV